MTKRRGSGIIYVLRLSLKLRHKEIDDVIICICRGKSDRDVNKAISSGASSVRELQRCGMGDQCGACVKSLRSMIAQASLSMPATMPAAAMAAACPTCGTAAVSASAMA